MAGWQSDYATVCKAVQAGLNPCPRLQQHTNMHKSALKTTRPGGEIGRHNGLKIRRLLKRPCRFDSGSGHHLLNPDTLRCIWIQYIYISRNTHLYILLLQLLYDIQNIKLIPEILLMIFYLLHIFLYIKNML